MSTFFLDTSALVKRYNPEKGTAWVRTLTATRLGHEIVIAQITPVEIMSGIARQYHDGQVTLAFLQSWRAVVENHVEYQYQQLDLTDTIVSSAINLHERHRLRAYDAVQLASALELQNRLSRNNRTFTFVSADIRLLAAATAEGLTTDNPTLYP